MRLLAVSALIAIQWFGAVCACSGIPRACRSYRTAKHIWLGLLHFHYGPILSLALVERGAPGKCLGGKMSTSSSCWLHCGSSPFSWGFSVCQCHAWDWEQGWARVWTRCSGWWLSGSWEATVVLRWHCVTSNGAVLSLGYWVTWVPAAGGREPASGAQPGPAGYPWGLLHKLRTSIFLLLGSCCHCLHALSPFCSPSVSLKGMISVCSSLSYENSGMWPAEQTGWLPLFCTVSLCNGKLHTLWARLLQQLA